MMEEVLCLILAVGIVACIAVTMRAVPKKPHESSPQETAS
jgi:hypothetical protein